MRIGLPVGRRSRIYVGPIGLLLLSPILLAAAELWILGIVIYGMLIAAYWLLRIAIPILAALVVVLAGTIHATIRYFRTRHEQKIWHLKPGKDGTYRYRPPS